MTAAHISIGALAEHTGLPIKWLKAEADGGRIPSLRVGRRQFFLLDDVRAAIARSATRQPERDPVSHASNSPIVRRMAYRLCKRPGRTAQDFEDVLQELLLHVHRRARLFDPERGNVDAFVIVVCRSWAKSDARRRLRPKRAGAVRTVSLDSVVESDGTPLWSVLTEADGLRRLGRCASPVGEALQRDDEIDGLLRNLSEKSRELVREVMASGVEEVARRRSVTPGRVRSMLSEARKDIRISRALP